MNTSDQSSEEQSTPSQPLYEYPGDQPPVPFARAGSGDEQPAPQAPVPSQQADSISTPESAELLPHQEEAIRQGLIYPPPPAFYQKQSSTTQQVPPPLPFPPPAGPVPQYPPPGMQPPMPTRIAPPRRSRRWVWIVIAISAVVLLASCGLCAWGFSALFGNSFRQAFTISQAGVTLTQNYYDAIEARNYQQAYSYLSPQDTISNMTEAQFAQQAQSQDTQYGPVLTYDPGNPSVDSNKLLNSDVTSFTMSVSVGRKNKQYSVLLTIQKVNGNWKITNFDRI